MSIIVDRIKKIAIPEKVTKGSGSKIKFILIYYLVVGLNYNNPKFVEKPAKRRVSIIPI